MQTLANYFSPILLRVQLHLGQKPLTLQLSNIFQTEETSPVQTNGKTEFPVTSELGH